MKILSIFLISRLRTFGGQVILILILIHVPLRSQCDPEYTYFDSIPDNINIISGDSCFYTGDLDVMDSLIVINNLDYNSPLELGTQTWLDGRLKILVAGNYGNSSGVNDTIYFLPDNIGNWDQLSSLYLEWNRIESLPENFSQLTNLQSLYISNNQLQYLPNDFGNLINLYFLDIGYNELDSLPESFCDLSSLTYFYTFNNELTTMPACICSLNLDWDGTDWSWFPFFAIGGNQLCENLPDCIENSEHLHTSLDQFYYSFMVTDSQDCDVVSIINKEQIPESFKLFEPYPNPFNPITTIRFSVETRLIASLLIYDITGRLVETLVDDVWNPGEHEIRWYAGKHPSGIYYIKFESRNTSTIKKVLLLK